MHKLQSMILSWFKPKYKVSVFKHIDQISDKMISSGYYESPEVRGIWHFLERDFNVKHKYNRRDGINYLIFDSEDDYLMFLLKL